MGDLFCSIFQNVQRTLFLNSLSHKRVEEKFWFLGIFIAKG